MNINTASFKPGKINNQTKMNYKLSFSGDILKETLEKFPDNLLAWSIYSNRTYRQNPDKKKATQQVAQTAAEIKGYRKCLFLDESKPPLEMAQFAARLPKSYESVCEGLVVGHGSGSIAADTSKGERTWTIAATKEPVFDFVQREFKQTEHVLVFTCHEGLPSNITEPDTAKKINVAEPGKFIAPTKLYVEDPVHSSERNKFHYKCNPKQSKQANVYLEPFDLETREIEGWQYIMPKT